MLFVIHMHIPRTQPRSSLVPEEQRETGIHATGKHPPARSRTLIPHPLGWMRPRATGAGLARGLSPPSWLGLGSRSSG